MNKISSINEVIEIDKSIIDSDDVKHKVIKDIFKELTMDYERKWLEKTVKEQLRIDSEVFKDNRNGEKTASVVNRSKQIIGEELSDSVVLF